MATGRTTTAARVKPTWHCATSWRSGAVVIAGGAGYALPPQRALSATSGTEPRGDSTYGTRSPSPKHWRAAMSSTSGATARSSSTEEEEAPEPEQPGSLITAGAAVRRSKSSQPSGCGRATCRVAWSPGLWATAPAARAGQRWISSAASPRGGSCPTTRSASGRQVVFSTQEDSLSRTIKQRSRWLRVDEPRVIAPSGGCCSTRTCASFKPCSPTSRVAVVVLDTFTAHISGAVDMYSNNDSRDKVLSPLCELAEKTRRRFPGDRPPTQERLQQGRPQRAGQRGLRRCGSWDLAGRSPARRLRRLHLHQPPQDEHRADDAQAALSPGAQRDAERSCTVEWVKEPQQKPEPPSKHDLGQGAHPDLRASRRCQVG